MLSATEPASARRLLFVGEVAYLAAGGRLERKPFSEEYEARVLTMSRHELYRLADLIG